MQKNYKILAIQQLLLEEVKKIENPKTKEKIIFLLQKLHKEIK